MSGTQPDLPRVRVALMEGRKLRCSVGQHVIVTDRKSADGGTGSGCTSGELLLVAAGSCATGAVRRYLDGREYPSRDMAVEVALKPAALPGSRDIIAIDIFVSADVREDDLPQIKTAALSGGVVGRLALGSEIEILVHRADAGSEKRDNPHVE